MNHATLPRATEHAVNSATPVLDLAATGERLSQLFSATLKQGRLHPLYMPLMNYRNAAVAT